MQARLLVTFHKRHASVTKINIGCSLQVQALAQATIQEVHDKLAARTAQVEDVQRSLQYARQSAAGEVASLQRQVQQLTQLARQQDQQQLKVSSLGNSSYSQVTGNNAEHLLLIRWAS